MSELGQAEGEVCRRNGCAGIIEDRPVEGCSCHINPPCAACTRPRSFCDECGWEQADDVVINNHVVNVDKKTGNWKMWSLRPLDESKIDWHDKTHTHFSMIKEGVYPPSATMSEVEKVVRGTFGGRFDEFGNGRFKYIAYTD